MELNRTIERGIERGLESGIEQATVNGINRGTIASGIKNRIESGIENRTTFHRFELQFQEYMMKVCNQNVDPSHDFLHVERVVRLTKKIAKLENANLDVAIPAAYLHDCVYISKTDPRRSLASQISADFALGLLRQWGYPSDFFEAIHHAIEAHSFSANRVTGSLEAMVVQDADRLDAMGAIGIFRCFAFSGLAKRPLYNSEDPFCEQREPNDQTNTLDHFFVKLLLLNSKLKTETGKKLGVEKLNYMKQYLTQLQKELSE